MAGNRRHDAFQKYFTTYSKRTYMFRRRQRKFTSHRKFLTYSWDDDDRAYMSGTNGGVNERHWYFVQSMKQFFVLNILNFIIGTSIKKRFFLSKTHHDDDDELKPVLCVNPMTDVSSTSTTWRSNQEKNANKTKLYSRNWNDCRKIFCMNLVPL